MKGWAIFLVISLCFSCNFFKKKSDEKIFAIKGFNDMKFILKIKPEIITLGESIYALLPINKKNTMAAVNEKGDFCFLEISKSSSISIRPILENYPPNFGQKFFSDPANNVLWMQRGRGVYMFDIKTKETGHVIASGDGNDKLLNIRLVDPEKNIFLIQVAPPLPLPWHYILYDMPNDKIIFKSPEHDAGYFPFYNNTLLVKGISSEKGKKHILYWQFRDLYYNKLPDNLLIKKLNKMQMDISNLVNTFHLKRRMMLGIQKITRLRLSAFWDEKMEDVQIQPLTVQLPPEDKILGGEYEFSEKGDWVKSVVRGDSVVGEMHRIIFFNTGDMYPQHLSMPIYGGYTKLDTVGAFFEHEVWGTCYAEMDPDFPDKLFIYKMNDAREELLKKGDEAIKQALEKLKK